MYSLTPSWPVYQLHNLHCYIQLRPQVRNGSSLKYRVLCSRVWPHLGQFSNLHKLQCYIQLRPQVRNGLSLKYRVLCSRVWPHLVQFSNLHNLECHIQLRPQVRNGLFEFQGIFFIPTRRISNKYKSASQIFCTSGSINFGRIFIIYAPNESSWKSSITKYHSQSCVGTLNHAK